MMPVHFPISKRHSRPQLLASALSTSSVIFATPTSPPVLTKPPSHRAPAARKTQLHRSYLSILRSSPLVILFQHNNVRATEWSALRRELRAALTKAVPPAKVGPDPFVDTTEITLLRTGVFASVLRVAEFYDPLGGKEHCSSEMAYQATAKKNCLFAPVLSGPVGALSFAGVSPLHLKVAIELLFPEDGKVKKGLDPLATSGLQKLVLLAARVDAHVANNMLGRGRVLDGDAVRWVSSLQGIEGMRGELLAILRGVGGGEVIKNLEAAGGIGLVRMVEGRRRLLNEEENSM